MGVTFRKCELGGFTISFLLTAYLTGNDRALSSLVFSSECQGILPFFPFFRSAGKRFYEERVHDLGRSAPFSDAVCWFTPFSFDCCEGMTCLVPGGFFTQDDAHDLRIAECPLVV